MLLFSRLITYLVYGTFLSFSKFSRHDPILFIKSFRKCFVIWKSIFHGNITDRHICLNELAISVFCCPVKEPRSIICSG